APPNSRTLTAPKPPESVPSGLSGGKAALPARHAFGVSPSGLSAGQARLPARHAFGVPREIHTSWRK
ncbi:MAG: hypothetical protein V3T14_09935, partial [Myxococcota bacterium]